MSKSRKLALIVGAIDLIGGPLLYHQRNPSMPTSVGQFLFVLALVIFALRVIWWSDDVADNISGSEIKPYSLNREYGPKYLKLLGWAFLVIFIPAGAWFSTLIGK